VFDDEKERNLETFSRVFRARPIAVYVTRAFCAIFIVAIYFATVMTEAGDSVSRDMRVPPNRRLHDVRIRVTAAIKLYIAFQIL